MIQNQSSIVKQEFKNITILFYAIVLGAILFAGVIIALDQFSETPIKELYIKKTIIIAAGLLAVICFFLANTLYKKKLIGVDSYEIPLNEKLLKYKAALVGYIGACEGAALFAIIAFFLTGEAALLGITALMLLAMFLKQPTKSRIFNDLQLDSKEQMELN